MNWQKRQRRTHERETERGTKNDREKPRRITGHGKHKREKEEEWAIWETDSKGSRVREMGLRQKPRKEIRKIRRHVQVTWLGKTERANAREREIEESKWMKAVGVWVW